MELLQQVGASITALFGILAIVKPNLVAKIIGLIPKGKRGISEIRAVYGGWIFGLGGYALWSQSEEVFFCLGIGWIGAGLVRIISFAIDKSYSSQNLRIVVYELFVATILLIKI
jgi:hypothetical protein